MKQGAVKRIHNVQPSYGGMYDSARDRNSRPVCGRPRKSLTRENNGRIKSGYRARLRTRGELPESEKKVRFYISISVAQPVH